MQSLIMIIKSNFFNKHFKLKVHVKHYISKKSYTNLLKRVLKKIPSHDFFKFIQNH